MGRKMTQGFVQYWERGPHQDGLAGVRVRAEDGEHAQGGVQQTLRARRWRKNVRVENGTRIEAVKQLKSRPGKDIIVYGGATFVRSLLEGGVLDELNLVVNPVAIGSGLQVFSGRQPLQLISSTEYSTGEVLNTYRPR